MYLSHPLGVTLCKVIINCNYVNSFSFESIKISRKSCNKCFSFTGSHLGNSSLMKYYSTYKLNPEMSHVKNSSCSLTNRRICLWQNIIKCLAFRKTLFEFICLASKLFVSKLLIFRFQTLNFINNRDDSLNFSFAMTFKQFT